MILNENILRLQPKFWSSKARREEVKRNKQNNFKSNQDEDRNREYDYVPALKQRKMDLQKQKDQAAKLPRIPKKLNRDQPGSSSAP